MNEKEIIELLTDGADEEVLKQIESIVKSGNAELISSVFRKYEDAINEYEDEEKAEEECANGDMSFGLSLYKGIARLILILGKVLKVNNYETIEEAYDLDDSAFSYIYDYKMFVEMFLDEDEKELEDANNMYEELKEVFDDANYDDYED